MISTAIDLLQKLGSGIRPDGGVRPAAEQNGTTGFAEMLSKVREGQVSSGTPVEIGDGVQLSLTPEQLERLSVAVDAAEASGSTRLLAMIDGHALTIDVPSRTILGVEDPTKGRMLTDFDSMVAVPQGSTKELQKLFAGPGAGSMSTPTNGSSLPGLDNIRNQSVADLLASRETQHN